MIDKEELKKILGPYRHPDFKRSTWQLINSFTLFILSWYAMYLSLSVSYWLTLALAFPAAGFMIRLFIVFHDCGHGSFFKSSKANDFWGMVTGIFVFTPYYQWRHEHAVHHATAGDLDQEGIGGIRVITVEDYRERKAWRKFIYRVYRNPVILFTFGALISFLFINRFTTGISNKKDRFSVHFTTLALVGISISLSLLIGFKNFVLIQLPILVVATSAGVWLFYVQHQFQGAYLERHEKWDRISASLKGSSYYDLPRVLHWFTGNIGFHHIHHLSPSIPNYFLEKCHKENPVFQGAHTLTLLSSLKSLRLRLYDEKARRMVGYPPKNQ